MHLPQLKNCTFAPPNPNGKFIGIILLPLVKIETCDYEYDKIKGG